MKKLLLSGVFVAGMLSVSAIGAQQPAGEQSGLPAAMAVMTDPSGKEVGRVLLAQTPSGYVHIVASFDGLPAGEHGFHIHEKGLCKPDFTAAGGHFNPTDQEHGIFVAKGPHAGDLPNLHVPDNEKLTVELFKADVNLFPGSEGSLVGGDGKTFIVHDHTDDYRSQPTGGAGARIACGVIVPLTQDAEGFQSYPAPTPEK